MTSAINLNDYRPTSEAYQARTVELMESYATVGLSQAGFYELNRRVRKIAAAYGVTYHDAFEHFLEEARENVSE